MMDQNITTIITTAFTVIGTLSGALGGVFLTNRHTTKLERLKIEEERNKRNNPIIEETYSSVNQVKNYYRKVSSDLFQMSLSGNDLSYNLLEKNQEILLLLERVNTLIHLYLPSLVTQMEKLNFSANSIHLPLLLHHLSLRQKLDTTRTSSDLEKAQEDFRTASNSLLSALEKMVR